MRIYLSFFSIGILTVCKNCSNNYHIACHIRSPAPARICPKCVLTMDEDEDVKDEVAEIESQVEEENKLPRCKKDEKFGKSSSVSQKRKSSPYTSTKRVIDKKVLVPTLLVRP